MIFIGCDPGKKGGLAFIYQTDEFTVTRSVPFSEEEYATIFRELKKVNESMACCIERVSAMPKQGVVSMFTFGQNYGWILGNLDAHEIPYETVTPKKWKAEFGLSGEKASSIEVCKHLFPHVSLLPNERCKKDSDGMAEALLIAEYARRKFGGVK